MKVYGYKLPTLPDNSRWEHSEEAPYPLYPFLVNPEESVDPACHLFEGIDGSQIVGFQVNLKMSESDMDALLKNAAKKEVYRVIF